MKQRIYSSIVGILLLLIVFFFYETPLLEIALAFLSGIAVYEVLISTHYLKHKAAGIVCALIAGISLILLKHSFSIYVMEIVLFMICLIGCVLKFHKQFSFQQLTLCVFTVISIPLSFSVVLRMDGVFYMILTCIAAWVTDMGAFFVGKACGKRKFAPEISPNKTVEGVVGGVICTGVIFPIVCYYYWKYFLTDIAFSFANAILVSLLCSIVGVMGDLFASIIKRETGIKDFGKIMPGHGGIMDRFDSFLFVAPTLFGLLQVFPIFIKI